MLQAMHHTKTAQDSVGADILLARHGSAISSLRLDKSRDLVVARLTDGSTDTAPNVISPAVAVHATRNEAFTIALVCSATGVFALMLAASYILTSGIWPAVQPF